VLSSCRLHYPVGMTITEDMQAAIVKVPSDAWMPAYGGDGRWDGATPSAPRLPTGHGPYV
jgi:hypothetical protein